MKIRMDFVYPSKYAELHTFLNDKDSAAWVKWEDILPEEFKEEEKGSIEIILLKSVVANGTTSFQVNLEVREQLVVRKDGKGQQDEFVWMVPSSHLKALLDLLEVFHCNGTLPNILKQPLAEIRAEIESWKMIRDRLTPADVHTSRARIDSFLENLENRMKMVF